MLDRLSKGDMTKYNEILEKGVIEVLNVMAFMKEKNEFEKTINKNGKKFT